MKKFYSVSDIPEEFIKKQITLRGKVKGHGQDHVLVEHLPILEGWKMSGKKPKGMPGILDRKNINYRPMLILLIFTVMLSFCS